MFGERLRQLRTERELTQDTLAKEISIGRAAISKYESNSMIPGIDILANLCSYFNVSADYLLGLSDLRLPRNQNLTDDEKRTLNYYRRLSAESQDIIKGRMVELYRDEHIRNESKKKKQTG